MTRDERESLQERLSDAERVAGDLKVEAGIARRRSAWGGAEREAYAQLADQLEDLASDFIGAAPFAAMRRRLEEDEQAAHDADARSQRIDYQRSVL